jgi:hypothetical protein
MIARRPALIAERRVSFAKNFVTTEFHTVRTDWLMCQKKCEAPRRRPQQCGVARSASAY